MGEWKYSSKHSVFAVDGNEWLALPPEKGSSVPIRQEAGWASEPDLLF
jgi:hypothetical protein